MPKGVKVHVLNVGQGMGNYIEVFGNGLGKPPTKTFIYDLGSEQGHEKYAPEVVKLIMRYLKKKENPKIDLIVFSHGDKDHWNIFPTLMKGCPGLTYGDVYYGGDISQYDYSDNGDTYNVLNALEGSKAKVMGQFADAASDFYAETPTVVAELDGLTVRLLLANIDEGIDLKATNGFSKSYNDTNSVSAVLVCEYAGQRFILTGDATGLTVQKINELIHEKNLKDQVNNTFLLLAPHHGSKYSLEYGNDDKLGPVKEFVKSCQATSIAASADYHKGFHHPDNEILKILANNNKDGYKAPQTEKETPDHWYVAFENNAWENFHTNVNIYTTKYTTDLNVREWIFVVTDEKKVFTERIPLSFRRLQATQSPLVNRNASVGDSAGLPVNTTEFSPVYKALRKKRAPGSNVGMFPQQTGANT